MTTRSRRLLVSLGALGCLSLALILAAEAAAAPSTELTRKRRTALGSLDQPFQAQATEWLVLRPVWLPPGANEKPPVAPRPEAQTLAIVNAIVAVPTPAPLNPVRRGGHGSTGIPKWLPPFPPVPVSPIR